MQPNYTNVTGSNLYLKDNENSSSKNSTISVSSRGHQNHDIMILISIACGLIILITVTYTFWQWRILKSKMNSQKNDSHTLYCPPNQFTLFPTFIEKSGSDFIDKEENIHLLGNNTSTENNGKITTPQQTKISEKNLKNALKRSRYFRGNCLKDGNDTMLMLAFTSVVSMGIVLCLHTTQGPRHVLVTMVGDEVRWQSVKQTNNKIKRYKLNLEDVMFVEIGKQLGHFQNVEEGTPIDCYSGIGSDDYDIQFDHLCFSLVTKKSSLHLEAASKLDRDSLVRGFQLRIESLRQ